MKKKIIILISLIFLLSSIGMYGGDLLKLDGKTIFPNTSYFDEQSFVSIIKNHYEIKGESAQAILMKLPKKGMTFEEKKAFFNKFFKNLKKANFITDGKISDLVPIAIYKKHSEKKLKKLYNTDYIFVTLFFPKKIILSASTSAINFLYQNPIFKKFDKKTKDENLDKGLDFEDNEDIDMDQINPPTKDAIFVKQAQAIKKVQPIYNKKLLNGKTQIIKVEVICDIFGKVVKQKVIEGIKSLHPSALEAAKQWQFEPYISNGVPKAFKTVLSFVFK